jgi:hypothetical protein
MPGTIGKIKKYRCKRYAYTLELTKGESDAIFWHGNRYCFTDLLCKHLHLKTEDENGPWVAELTEAEAWELKEAWNDDGGSLACGSNELIHKIDQFMEKII